MRRDNRVDTIDTEALFYVLEEVPGRLSPYVPTPYYLKDYLAKLLYQLITRYRLDIVYEPGCGAGEVAEAIEANANPKYYIGLEIDADLARRAKTRINLGDIIVGDLRRPPLRRRPLLVYAYLLPKPLDYVVESLEPGSIVVSLEYEPETRDCLETLEEHRIDTILTVHHVRIYRVDCGKKGVKD